MVACVKGVYEAMMVESRLRGLGGIGFVVLAILGASVVMGFACLAMVCRV